MTETDLTVDFKAFQDQVTSSLVNVTRSAGQISNEDLSFHRSSSGKLSKALDEQNTRLLKLTNKLLKAATKGTNNTAPKLQDHDSIDDHWRKIVDVVDDLLEKADASLDEFSGVLKRLSPSVQDGTFTPPRTKEKSKIFNIFQNASMAKPQLLFDVKVNNYETKPFRPLLKTKPHAVVPLEESIGEAGHEGYSHPYATEIEQSKYPPATYKVTKPIPFNPPDDSSVILVDTEEGVGEMLAELKQAREIAVDLEHHDMHSYIGITSLIQISTREKDWIVDPLVPWRQKLQVLNEVFTDPNILKVFHGSAMDIIWLQRDLGLYVIGLFDTYHAAVALNFPGKGLKYLLERFANFHAEKKYQMADWRVRPLPEELVNYARSDTHYLLYVYDVLRNMLLEASTPTDNLVDQVLEGSKKEALQVYQRPVYDKLYGLGAGGWFKSVTQRAIKFDGPQLSVYKALHLWRDQKARKLDEGEQYIFSQSNLFSMAEFMPTSVPSLYACMRSVPKPISENSRELIEVIKKAKIQGQTEPSLKEVVQATEEKFGAAKVWGRRFLSQKPTQTENRGVAGLLQTLAQNGDVAPVSSSSTTVVDDGDLKAGRSLTSQFWGLSLPQPGGISHETTAIAMQALGSVLPLPSKSETLKSVVEDGNHPAILGQRSAPTPVLPDSVGDESAQVVAENKQDEIFTLRNRSKKRRAEEELGVPEEVIQEDTISLGNLEQERKTEKQRRKAEKRAEKRAKKATKAAELAAVEPFDYANAQSVMHVKPDEAREKKKDKLVNPYTKALDTSTGARRTNKEGPGKSFTFKK